MLDDHQQIKKEPSMALNRRSLLRAMPALPFAARAARESVAQGLMQSAGENIPSPPYGAPTEAVSGNWSMTKMRALLKHKEVLDEMREQIAYDIGVPNKIDPDIAIKCWSLNVKYQHQRQRNIERQLQCWIDDSLYEKRSSSTYDVMHRWAKKYFIGV